MEKELYVGIEKGVVTLYEGGPAGVGRAVGYAKNGYRDVDGRPVRRWWAYDEDGACIGGGRNRALAFEVVVRNAQAAAA